jgi:hypothetical protein
MLSIVVYLTSDEFVIGPITRQTEIIFSACTNISF